MEDFKWEGQTKSRILGNFLSINREWRPECQDPGFILTFYLIAVENRIKKPKLSLKRGISFINTRAIVS